MYHEQYRKTEERERASRCRRSCQVRRFPLILRRGHWARLGPSLALLHRHVSAYLAHVHFLSGMITHSYTRTCIRVYMNIHIHVYAYTNKTALRNTKGPFLALSALSLPILALSALSLPKANLQFASEQCAQDGQPDLGAHGPSDQMLHLCC